MGSGSSNAAKAQLGDPQPNSHRSKTVRQSSQQRLVSTKTEVQLVRQNYKVFISYSEEDCGGQTVDNFVHFLKSKLGEKGYRAYVTEDELKPTDDRGHILMETIMPIPVLVSICSSSYGRQKWANRECDLASRLGKPIIPLLYSGTYPPARLNLVQLPATFFDFRDKSQWLENIDRLAAQIKDALDGKKASQQQQPAAQLLTVDKPQQQPGIVTPVPRTPVPSAALPEIRKSPRPPAETLPGAQRRMQSSPSLTPNSSSSPSDGSARNLSPSQSVTDSASVDFDEAASHASGGGNELKPSSAQHGSSPSLLPKSSSLRSMPGGGGGRMAINGGGIPRSNKRASTESLSLDSDDDDATNWDDMPLYDNTRPKPARPRVLVPLLKYDLAKLDNSLDPAAFVKTDDAIMYAKKPRRVPTYASKSALPVSTVKKTLEPPKPVVPAISPISEELTKLLDMFDSEWEK